MPGGLGWGNEAMQVGTHSATHVDAPYHFYPTCGGKPAPKIDELPLDWFWGPAVVLDLRHISAGRAATRYDIRAALDDIGYALRPGDIVCLMFGADRLYGTKNYWYQFPGIGADAVRFIVESGVRVIGTDAYGFDVPFEVAKARFAETGDPTLIWEAHRVGMELCYSHIEKMAHLEEMPPLGAYLSCFPVNIRHASAGWTRCVGFIPEEPF